MGTTVVRETTAISTTSTSRTRTLSSATRPGKTCLTAPDGIGLVDLDTLTPLTNADTKVGMRLLVTMTPRPSPLVDEEHKALHLLAAELDRVGMKGDQVRY